MLPELENYIQNNLDELDRKRPGPAVLEKVLREMEANGKPASRGILISFRTIRWAAACIAAVTCTIMLWPVHQQPAVASVTKRNELKQPGKARLSTIPTDTIEHTAVHPGIEAVNKDLAVRTSTLAHDLTVTKLVSFAGFSKIPSAADRITAVATAATLKNSGNEVIDGLLDVLDRDPNTNVRLAALDGLARFYRSDYTRKKLLVSLKKQTDPIVQIALIGLLTRMRESGIIAELEKLVQDQHTEKTVKDCAYSSILQLDI